MDLASETAGSKVWTGLRDSIEVKPKIKRTSIDAWLRVSKIVKIFAMVGLNPAFWKMLVALSSRKKDDKNFKCIALSRYSVAMSSK